MNVHQLRHHVEKLIKTVEDSSLACESRNVMARRLRKLDDALLSGRTSAAKVVAPAWARNAGSLQAARVLSAEVGSVVQTYLGGLDDQIGTGWAVEAGPTRHWKPFPSCEPGGIVGSYVPDISIHTSADIEALVKGLVFLVPTVGGVAAGDSLGAAMDPRPPSKCLSWEVEE